MKKLNLAVIFGGRSGEHEVSLRSAKQVMDALDKEKYNIIPIAITKDGKWLLAEKGTEYMEKNLPQAGQQGGVSIVPEAQPEEEKNKLLKINEEESRQIDLILPICHGPFMEDGKLQGMLSMMDIPFVFSGTLASALAMNKRKTKIIAKAASLKIAKDVVVIKGKKINCEKIIAKLNLPIVVKPAELGSSVGTSLASSQKELEEAIDTAFNFGEEVLLEQFIKGRELTVAVMGDRRPKALPVIEIIPKISGWFDYRAKYEKGGSEEVCPAKIPKDIEKKVQKYAVKIFEALGCQDLSRADFIWSEKDQKIYFLEINTIPGMTATSLAPQAAAAQGMSFSEFLDKLIESALKRSKRRELL